MILLAVLVSAPLATLHYVFTNSYPTGPILRLVLEGLFFLIAYPISLRFFRLVAREDFDLLERALPTRVRKLALVVENVVIR